MPSSSAPTVIATDPLTGPYSLIRVYEEGRCQVGGCGRSTTGFHVLCKSCDKVMAGRSLPPEYRVAHGLVYGPYVLRCEELATVWGRYPW